MYHKNCGTFIGFSKDLNEEIEITTDRLDSLAFAEQKGGL